MENKELENTEQHVHTWGEIESSYMKGWMRGAEEFQRCLTCNIIRRIN